MTEEKELCKFYQKGRKCNLKQDDFRCIENLGGNCASYRYYAFELEQENKDLKKQIESDKGLITVGGKQQYQYLQKIDELEQENKELGRKAFLAEQNVRTTAATFCEKDNKIIELEQKNKELKAYKDVNEDFKKAWDELNKKYTEVLNLAKTNADSNEYCLQELEKENKELKAETLQWKQIKDMANNNKYRSVLEEIREVLKLYADSWVDEKIYPNLHYDNTKAKEGLSRINEVLNDN